MSLQEALVNEIVGKRIFKEQELNRLFRATMELADDHTLPIVEEVIRQLKRELYIS